MMAERTLDYGLAIQVANSVFDEISEDGVTEFLPDVINEYWVSITTDQLIGIYRIHQLNAITYQIHALIMPEHRGHAKESGRVILRWCLDNIDFAKLVAEIPEKYPNVYHFTKSMGFFDEGTNRLSFLKDKTVWNTHRLGQTREEVETWLQH